MATRKAQISLKTIKTVYFTYLGKYPLIKAATSGLSSATTANLINAHQQQQPQPTPGNN